MAGLVARASSRPGLEGNLTPSRYLGFRSPVLGDAPPENRFLPYAYGFRLALRDRTV